VVKLWSWGSRLTDTCLGLLTFFFFFFFEVYTPAGGNFEKCYVMCFVLLVLD